VGGSSDVAKLNDKMESALSLMREQFDRLVSERTAFDESAQLEYDAIAEERHSLSSERERMQRFHVCRLFVFSLVCSS
jgi:hypothetical protein